MIFHFLAMGSWVERDITQIPVRMGGSTTLSVTGRRQGQAVMNHPAVFGSAPLSNIAQPHDMGRQSIQAPFRLTTQL
ncbi:Uncharacterised protein [Mycobacterium tuberculosis]|nr:Uncharacterised protein [Mycobacterium tuberculosis]